MLSPTLWFLLAFQPGWKLCVLRCLLLSFLLRYKRARYLFSTTVIPYGWLKGGGEANMWSIKGRKGKTTASSSFFLSNMSEWHCAERTEWVWQARTQARTHVSTVSEGFGSFACVCGIEEEIRKLSGERDGFLPFFRWGLFEGEGGNKSLRRERGGVIVS